LTCLWPTAANCDRQDRLSSPPPLPRVPARARGVSCSPPPSRAVVALRVCACGCAWCSVSVKIFRLFRCLPVDGKYYLAADMRLQCYTAEWVRGGGVAATRSQFVAHLTLVLPASSPSALMEACGCAPPPLVFLCVPHCSALLPFVRSASVLSTVPSSRVCRPATPRMASLRPVCTLRACPLPFSWFCDGTGRRCLGQAARLQWRA
jgi:hypothetical protein